MSGAFSWDEAVGAAPPAAAVSPPPQPAAAPTTAPAPAAAAQPAQPATFSWEEAQHPAPSAATSDTPAASKGGFFSNLLAGGVETASGLLKDTVGLPLHLLSAVRGGTTLGLEQPSGMHLAGDDVAAAVPQTSGLDQLGRAIGGGIVGGVAGPAEDLAVNAPSVLSAAGRLAARAGTGAAAAVGGDVAANQVPDAYKPAAELLGGIAGGGAAAAGSAGVRAAGAAGAAVQNTADAASPFGKQVVTDADGKPILGEDGAPLMATKGQQRIAGGRMVNAASDPNAATAAALAPDPLAIPGVSPTIGQVTQDPGLMTLERGVSRGPAQGAFVERQNDNQKGFRDFADAQAGNVDPNTITGAFRNVLDNMTVKDIATQQEQQQAAKAATAGLGGAGVMTPGDTALQQAGQAMRAGPAATVANLKGQASDLFNAVDPQGTLRVASAPLKDAADQVSKGIGLSAPPAPQVQQIIDTARVQPAVMPFSGLQQFRTRVTDAIRSIRSDPQANQQDLPRLAQMLDAVHDTMTQGVGAQIERDAPQIASGALSPANSTMGRVSDLIAEQNRAEPTSVASGATPGTIGADPAPELPAARVGTPGGNDGANLQATGRLGDPSGASSLSPAVGAVQEPKVERSDTAPSARQSNGGVKPPVSDEEFEKFVRGNTPPAPTEQPNLTQEAVDTYAAARARYAQAMEAKNAPGIAPILKSGPTAGSYALDDSRVPGTIFGPGKGAAEKVQAYLTHGGDKGALEDHAAYSLRKVAETPAGGIDPGKFADWSKAHAEAMANLPELAAKMKTAAGAQSTLEAMAAAHRDAQRAFERSAAGRYLGGADPVNVTLSALMSKDALPVFSDLAKRTAAMPEAREGLQRAVITGVLKEIDSGGAPKILSALQTNAANTFERHIPQAIRQLFTSNQAKALTLLADAYARAKSIDKRTRIGTGSDTIQNKHAGGEEGEHGGSLLNVVLAEHGGEMAEHALGHLGVVGAIAGHATVPALLIGRLMKARGLKTASDLVAEGILHPRLGAHLMAKYTPRTAPVVMAPLMKSLRSLPLRASIDTTRSDQNGG